MSRPASVKLGRRFLKLANAAYSAESDSVLSIHFLGEGRNGTPIDVTFANEKPRRAKVEDLSLNQWLVLGMELYANGNKCICRITNLSDAGAAARLTGLAGFVDTIPFRKGKNPDNPDNFKTRRVMLSGNNLLLQ